ncbi:MAG: zinc-binding dehydrogenase [Deltaproteobacteria bacterium]|nr:zinc-binding dehydrogenase [Deltaproteobacteria bacterium]
MLPNTCKAAVLTEYGKPLEIREVSIPEVEPGGILVKVEVAGICGTDVHYQRGELTIRPPLPTIPGHETIGRIVRLGQGRRADVAGEALSLGDRILWAHVDCGECYGCGISRDSACCEHRTLYGYAPPEALRGGFAEYEYLTPQTKVVKIPAELTEEETIGVGCAFRTAVGAYERFGGIRFQETVVIQGAGPVGLYSALIAAESGAGKVIVIGAPEERLELARRWGASHVLDLERFRTPAERKQQVLELTKGRGPEVVVECSGVPGAFNEGLDMIQKGGRYLVVGQTSADTVPVAPGVITGKGLTLIGGVAASVPHYYKAVRFLVERRDRYPLSDIVTHKYPLEGINEALALKASGKAIKPVIDNRGR